MASPASIGGHPIHPMIIPFPIALWVFSLVADVIFLWRGNPVWRNYIAFYALLAGIIGAVAAAVPGFIDWLSLTDKAVVKIAKLARTSQRYCAANFCCKLLSAYDKRRELSKRQLHTSPGALGVRRHFDHYLRLVGRRNGFQTPCGC